MLQKTIPQLMNAAGYDGYYSNPSLRISVATKLFAAGVDEHFDNVKNRPFISKWGPYLQT